MSRCGSKSRHSAEPQGRVKGLRIGGISPGKYVMKASRKEESQTVCLVVQAHVNPDRTGYQGLGQRYVRYLKRREFPSCDVWGGCRTDSPPTSAFLKRSQLPAVKHATAIDGPIATFLNSSSDVLHGWHLGSIVAIPRAMHNGQISVPQISASKSQPAHPAACSCSISK
jgi:hypothetical protein